MNRNNIPERWKFLKLKNIAKEVNIKATKQHSYEVFSVTKYDGFVRSSDYFKKQVFSRDTSNYKVVKPNQFAYATIHLDEGSIGLLNYHTPVIISPMYKVFEVNNSVVYNPYLLRLLKSSRMLAQYALLGSGSVHRRKAISFHKLGSIEIPLPPLEEQKRIAAILDKADAIRRKRKEAIRLTEELLQSTFLDMFGDPVTNPKGWKQQRLDAFSLIQSGIAKGKKVDPSQAIYMPYIRVANVQDGYLNLDEIKELKILPSDVNRYLLKDGDLLLTEGGDPDKLGRGAIWHNQIKPCIHQNHIFAVRPLKNVVEPEYLSALIGSDYGKRYFLRAAKQTTGIATINKTQLKSFPVLLPPINLQRKYIKFVQSLNSTKEDYLKIQYYTDKLFNSLLQKSFRGEL